jgi:hypothetical protein
VLSGIETVQLYPHDYRNKKDEMIASTNLAFLPEP